MRNVNRAWAAVPRASRNVDLSVYSQQRSCDSVQPRATALGEMAAERRALKVRVELIPNIIARRKPPVRLGIDRYYYALSALGVWVIAFPRASALGFFLAAASLLKIGVARQSLLLSR